MNLSYLGSVSCGFTSRISLGHTIVSGYRLMTARSQVFFLSSLRAYQFTICDDCGILCLWIWQEIFHFSPCICMDFINEIPSPHPTPTGFQLSSSSERHKGEIRERYKSEVTKSFLMGLLLAVPQLNHSCSQLWLQFHSNSQVALTPCILFLPTEVAKPSQLLQAQEW